MANKDYNYKSNIINSIQDISNKYFDTLLYKQNSIETISNITLSEKKIFHEEINKYKASKPLVNLLPFDYLGPLKGTFYERAHTMILAFLLDPKCSGKFAGIFLQKILSEIGERNIRKYSITKVFSESISLKSHDTSGMPDIEIELENNKELLRIIIENKCLAVESVDQTPKYMRGKRKISCKKCIKQKNEKPKPLCKKPKDKIGLFIDFKGRQASCHMFRSLNYDVIKESLQKAKLELLVDLEEETLPLNQLIDNYIKTIKGMNRGENIVSYDDIGKIDNLSILQCKYLVDRINNISEREI